jgi:hypothetical protein
LQKASPINVKGDPLALTYDDSLHNNHTINPVHLKISKAEADARFPHLVRDRNKNKPEANRPAARAPIPEFETEAEEDARKLAEKELAAKREAEVRMERLANDRDSKDLYRPEKLDETIKERKARWKWETTEDQRRPWRTLANRGIHRSWDDRVLYDPVTMVRLVSFTARG